MQIGRLDKIDVREIWKGEATDFTPWLANEDNLKLLGDTVGFDLELVGEEKNVGPFRADILCKNTLEDTYVLIENQLEKTDHTHLGQIMTYAAGLEAVNIVWIAKKFTDEHRAALDWLNRVTNEKLRFFGIELEVYKIGNSIPAPFFQMVSKPNDWTKSPTKLQNLGDLTETKTLNLEYWTEFKKYLESQNSSLRSQKPSPQHWTNYSIGRTGFKLCLAASVRDSFLRVEFVIEGKQANERFLELKHKFEQASIVEIDDKIQWDILEDKIASYVYLKKEANISKRADWNDQFYWAMQNLEKFDSFFRNKIKNLK